MTAEALRPPSDGRFRLSPELGRRLVLTLSLILAAWVAVVDVSALVRTWNRDRGEVYDGFLWGDGEGARGFMNVNWVDPEGPGAQAGFRVGDQVRLADPDHNWGGKIGEVVKGWRRRDGVVTPVQWTLIQAEWTAEQEAQRPFELLSRGVLAFGALTAAFVMFRSRGAGSASLLGIAIACNMLGGVGPPFWINDPKWTTVLSLLNVAILSGACVAYFAFARRFRQETSGKDGALARWSWRILAAVIGGAWLVSAIQNLVIDVNWIEGLNTVFAASVFIGMGLAMATLFAGWRDAERETRSRYVVMLLGVGAMAMLQVFGLIINLTSNDFRLSNPLAVGYTFTPLIGLLLFIYAVFRHRVLDVGFAVNRTLVYGALSTVLLLAFGLAEKGIEALLPESAHQANALVSAGIALVIFLFFHHARDIVEKVIEGLFFRRWRENESQLKRFVRRAAYFTRPHGLLDGLVAELRRFSSGASVGVWQGQANGYVRLTADGGAKRLDLDEPVLVALRAEREPLEGEAAAALGAALVLPMTYRDELTGFVALGLKPNGEVWRPDERAALADAVQKTGLDLHALRLEALERENTELKQSQRMLRTELRRALAG